MVKCKSCGVEGSYKYNICGWHQDLADEVLIDEKTDKCFKCLNKEKTE
jgi:alpha-D-ribose 1-methylphosphonate 5-phosphate C-P lyase